MAAASVNLFAQKLADYVSRLGTDAALQSVVAPGLLTCNLFGAPAASTSYYGAPGWSLDRASFFAILASNQEQVPFAGKLSKLRATVHQGNMAGGNCVVTVYKNGVTTGITATIASGASAASDLSNTATFAAGDVIQFGFAFGVGVTSAGGAPQGVAAYIQYTQI